MVRASPRLPKLLSTLSLITWKKCTIIFINLIMNLLHGHFNLDFWATYGISLEFKSQPSPVGKRLSFFKFVSFYFFLDSKVILLLRSFCQQPLPKTDIPSNVFSFVVILMPFFFCIICPSPFSEFLSQICPIIVLKTWLYVLHHWWDGSCKGKTQFFPFSV